MIIKVANALLQIEQEHFRITIAHILDPEFFPSHTRDISSISFPQNMLHAIPARYLYSASVGCFRVIPGCLDDVDVSLARTSREGMWKRGGWREDG